MKTEIIPFYFYIIFLLWTNKKRENKVGERKRIAAFKRINDRK